MRLPDNAITPAPGKPRYRRERDCPATGSAAPIDRRLGVGARQVRT